MGTEMQRDEEPTWIAVASPAPRRLRSSAKRRRRRRKTLVILSSFLVLVLVAGGLAGGYLWNLAHKFDQRTQSIPQAFPNEDTRPQRSAEDKSENYLLLGSDSRDDSTTGQDSTTNAGRSDTIMIVHVPADRKNVTITSILRDTWVQIPGHGEAKLNAAFSYGGIPLAVQTLESIFGARIDHVVTIDFSGFMGLVDAVGGVDITVPVPFTGPGNRRFEGTMHMDGATALDFVRQRKAFVDGDYQRVRDQQLLLKAVFSKLLSADVLLNPGTVANALDEMSPFLGLDDSLSALKLAQRGVSLNSVRPDDVVMFTLPTNGTGRSPDGKQSIVLADPKAIRDFSQALKNDTVVSYARSVLAGGGK